MSGSLRLDMAGLAASTVYTADQLWKAMEAGHEHKDKVKNRYLAHAAVGAVVAAGAVALLSQDEKKESEEQGLVVAIDGGHGHHHHHQKVVLEDSPNPGTQEPPGHRRRMLEEALALYSAGREVLGHKEHHSMHQILEALGAIAAYKQSQDHSHGVV